MADSKKISDLTPVTSLEDTDEFLVIDKQGFTDTKDSGGGGKTSKITLENLRDAVGTAGPQGVPGPIAGTNMQFVYNNNGAAAGADVYFKDGKVGIGTPGPSSPLHVHNTGGNTAARFARSTDNGGGSSYLLAITELNDNNARLDMQNDAGLSKVRIETSGDSYFTGGNVGIGTNQPANKLEIYTKNDNERGLLLNREDTNSEASIGFATGGATNWAIGMDNFSTNDFFLWNSGTNSQALAIKSSTGHVGIGTDNPRSRLSLPTNGGDHNGETNQNPIASSADGISMGDHGNSYGFNLWHDNAGPGGGNFAQTVTYFDSVYNHDDSLMKFRMRTSEDNNTGPIDAMTIKGNGNVGIGRVQPNEKLTLIGEDLLASMKIQFNIQAHQIADSSGTTDVGFIESERHTADGRLSDLHFGTMGERRMTIDHTGNVGIGTDSPDRNLTVAGNFRLEKTEVDGGHPALDFNSGGGADHPELNIYDKDGNAGAFILKGGNVGIGTSSPDAELDVIGEISSGHNIGADSEYKCFSIRSSRSVDDYGGLGKDYWTMKLKTLGLTTGVLGDWTAGADHRVGNLVFQRTKDYLSSDMVDTMTLSHDGNVGIGISSPTSRLDVLSTGSGDGIKLTPSTSNAYAMVHEGSSGNVGFQLRSSGADGSSAPSLSFSSDANDNYILDGNVGIGISSPESKLEIHASNTSSAFSIYNKVDDDMKMNSAVYDNGGTLSLLNDGVVKVHIDGRHGTPNDTYFNAGNVGIGTASPHANLHIHHESTDINPFAGGALEPNLTSLLLETSTDGTSVPINAHTSIGFNSGTDKIGSAIVNRYRGEHSAGNSGLADLQFYVNSGNGWEDTNYIMSLQGSTGNAAYGNQRVHIRASLDVHGEITTDGEVVATGFDADNLDNVRATDANGLDSINNLVVSDFEKDGVTKVGIVAQDMQKVLPQSVSGGDEYEEVVAEAEGRVVKGLGTDDEHEYCPSLKKSDYAEHDWDEGAEFVETKAEETETRNHSLATSNDELIATLVKAVQELSAKNDELSAELNELKSK